MNVEGEEHDSCLAGLRMFEITKEMGGGKESTVSKERLQLKIQGFSFF